MAKQDGKFLPLMQQAGPVIRALRLTSLAAQIGAGATSVMIVSVVAYARWREVLPPTGATIATGLVVTLFLLVVEGGLKTFTPFGLDELFSLRLIREESRAKRIYRAAFALVCLTLIAGLGFGTISTSWIGRQDMAEVATPPPQLADLAGITARQERTLARMDSSYEAKLAHLRDTEAERLAAAQQEAARLQAVAIASQGAKMALLYRQGNGWAAQQLADTLARAQQRGEALIATTRQAVAEMEQEKRRYLTVQETDYRDRFRSVEAQNHQKAGSWQSKYDRNSALIGFFGVGCTAIFFVAQVLLSLARIVSDVPTFTDERGADARAGKLPAKPLAWPTVNLSWPNLSPSAQQRPIDIRNGAPRPESETGPNSPNMSGHTGHNSAIMSASPPPDNTGKKYGQDRRRQETLQRVQTAYQALLAEHNAPPRAVDVARLVGRNEKTVRSALKELDLFY